MIPQPTSATRAADRLPPTGRVAYLAKMFPRVSETFILREILALKESGVPTRIYSLLTPTRDARIQSQARALMVETTVLPMPGWRQARLCLRALGSTARRNPAAVGREFGRVLLRPRPRCWKRFFRALLLAEQMRRDRIAHLHAAWAHTPASVARIASRLTGIPWSMGAHAKDIFLSHPRSLAKKLAAARFTLSCSATHRDHLAALATRAEHEVAPRVELYHHGVDCAFFRPSRPEGGEEPAPATPAGVPLLVSVGRLVPKKGFDTLLRSAAALRDRGVAFRLEIIGAGPLRSALVDQIGALDLQDRVALRGMLVLEEVRAAYRRAAVVVLASRITANGDRDGIPNTLAEAMACAVPVVASATPSIAELVHDEETGLLVPADDSEALAQALQRLLADAALRHRLGRAGRAWVAEFFDAEAWGRHVARRLDRARGTERMLYLSADRGVPVRGHKGASVHVRSVVQALQSLGSELRIVTTRPGPQDGPSVSAPIVRSGCGNRSKDLMARLSQALRGGRALERSFVRLIDNIAVYRRVRQLTQSWRPDAIYERYALCAVAGSLLARRLGVPHILEVNAPLADEEARFRDLRLRRLTHLLERRLLRRADRVVVVSRALEQHVRRLGVAPARILLLPNAVDPEVFHPDRDGARVRAELGCNGAFVVGFSGTLKPWHGVRHLIRAMPDLIASGAAAHLLLIGDGPERENLAALAGELGIASHVHFTGALPHAEVGDYLAASDVLVAPYGHLENHWFSPLKVAEYRAVGRPVVASAIGQLAEGTAEEQGTVLVRPEDEDALAQALIALASNPVRRRALGHRAAAASTWTWQALARRLLQEIETARRELWRWHDA